MKKLVLIGAMFVSANLFAMNRPNIIYLKSHSKQYDASYKDMGNNTIRWTIKANKKLLKRLVSHIYFMENKIASGTSPRINDKFFNIENVMGKYVHYRIGYDNGNLIIDKSADNVCAFEIIKAHAKIVHDDFFNGVLNKNYSNVATKIINSPECKPFKDILKK